jgi:hypothetical protein
LVKASNNEDKPLSNSININIKTNNNNNYKITNSYILDDYKNFNNFSSIGLWDNSDIKKILKNFNKSI